MERQRKIHAATVTLGVLLAVSLIALGSTIFSDRLAGSADAAATSVSSLILAPGGGASSARSSEVASNDTAQDAVTTETIGSADPAAIASSSPPANATSAPADEAATIQLYAANPQENTPFKVGNMLPGDAQTKYFRVRVSYHDTVTVHYKAAVQSGYEKLAEVLKLRVRLVTTDQTIYDGLMRDASQALAYQLISNSSTTDELLYEVTAYLDTSVGNDYQNKDLAADFTWWVAEDQRANLEPIPFTGDLSRALPWACMAAACAAGLVLLALSSRSRRGGEDGGQKHYR